MFDYHGRAFAAFVLAATFAIAPGQPAAAATITPTDLPRPEGVRQYLLAVPDKSPAGKRPLVVLLHGHGGSAAQLLGQGRGAAPLSAWLAIADREGLLVAAPDGVKGSDNRQGWNDCRADAQNNPTTDDVGLIAAIIDREVAAHDADPTRVFVMGMSNGGMMAFRLAIEIGPRLAGFAAVSASMAARSGCPAPRAAVSALIVSGVADPLVPYTGGDVRLRSTRSRGAVVPVEESAATWRAQNRLPAEPAAVTPLAHRDSGDPTSATRTLWGGDPARPQVELLRIDNGGHVEPSIAHRIGRIYATLVGPQNGDVESAEEAWAFFKDKRAGPAFQGPPQ